MSSSSESYDACESLVLLSIPLSKSPMSSEKGLKSLISQHLPREFSLIGFYGSKDYCFNIVSEYFNEPIPNIADPSQLILVIDKENTSAALVYYTAETFFLQKPLDQYDPCCFYVGVLLSMCKTVVPCFSNDILESWYYNEENSFKNPFVSIYKNVSKEFTLKQKYISGVSYEIQHFFDNPNDLCYSFTSVYKSSELSIDINAMIEIRRYNSEFILRMVNSDFDLERLSLIFREHVSRLKEFIICPEDVLEKIFEKINDIMYKENSEISAIISDMCDNIVNDVLDANFTIDEKTSGILRKTSFSDGISKFREGVLKLNSKISFEKVDAAFKSSMFKFIEANDSEKVAATRILNKNWMIAEEKIRNAHVRTREANMKTLEHLETYRIQKKIKISRYDPYEDTDGTMKFRELPDSSYILCFHKPVGKTSQILELNSTSVLLLIEDEGKGFTQFYLITPDSNQQVLSIPGLNLEVAKGSIRNQIVIISNSKNQLLVYEYKDPKLQESKKFKTKLDYVINFPCFIPDSNKLLFINERKELMFYDLSAEELKATYYDLSSFSMNTPFIAESFERLSISESGKILVLLMESNTVYFLEFETQTIIKLNMKSKSILEFHLIQTANSHHLLSVKKNIVHALKFTKTGSISVAHRVLIGNPILDVLHHAICNNRGSDSIKCKHIFCYNKLPTSQDLIQKYFSSLKYVNKHISLGGFISDFEESLECEFYTPDTFVLNLSLLLPESLVEICPFIPLFNGQDKISLLLSQSPNPSLVEYISNYLDLGIIEEVLNYYPEITVIGIVGPNHESNRVLASHLFKTNSMYFKYSQISLALSEVDGRRFLVIIFETMIKPLSNDSIRCLEFASAICDTIILNIFPEQEHGLKTLLKQLFYCKNRIADDFLYKYSLNITYFPVPKNYSPSSALQDSLLLPMTISHSALTSEDSYSFPAEISLIRSKYLQSTPSRWKGEELVFAIKSCISQLFVGDSHSLDYWRNKAKDTQKSPTRECKHPWICDIEVKKTRIDSFSIYKFAQNAVCYNGERCDAVGESRGCNDKCPKCEEFCDLEYGHFGKHSLKMHRKGEMEGCDVKFFNNYVLGYGIRDASVEKRLEIIESWHESNWETPWESVAGLVPIETELLISKAQVKDHRSLRKEQKPDACTIS